MRRPFELHRTALRLLITVAAFAACGTLASWSVGAAVYPIRVVAYAAIVVAGAVAIRRPNPDAAPAVSFAYLVWWGLSLADALTSADIGHDDRVTLSVALMILSLVIPFFRREHIRGLVVFFSITNGTWVVITAVSVSTALPDVINQALAMLVGYLMISMMHRKFLEDGAEATRHAERSASIQSVLAAISHALMVHEDDEALRSALVVAAKWTGCEAALVESIDRSGTPARRVVASFGDPPARAGSDHEIDGAVDLLNVGAGAHRQRGATIQSRPLGQSDHTEMLAPIVVRGIKRGTISMFWSAPPDQLDQFTEHILGRSAELIAAYWDRMEAHDRLRQLVESKDRFVASVSHELRTPLTAVVGFTQEMVTGFDDMGTEEVKDYLRLVAQQSSEVAQIVEDLLVAARADIGTLKVRPAFVELKHEADSIVEQLRLTSLEHATVGITGERAPVFVDRLRCRQIIRNLLTNAARYGGRSIRVTTGSAGRRSWLQVIDDGQGIPPEKLGSIFEPYVSAHEQVGQPGSIGLGLSVARDLAQLMGGTLEARSRPGETVFEVTFPVAVPSEATPDITNEMPRTA